MSWLSRIAAIVRSRKLERDLDQELQFHMELKTQENIAAGMEPEEARYAALRAFGGVEQKKEECRDTSGVRFIMELGQDLRYGLRQLHRNPAFTLLAVVTLALGIGATTAIFSILDAIVLRPVPYKDPGRLAVLWTDNLRKNLHAERTSYPNFEDWRRQNRTFEDMAFASAVIAFLTGGEGSERILTARATPNFFSMLGIRPSLGRVFTREDEARGERVIVLSYGMWQRRFGGSKEVLGKTLGVNGSSATVIGVVPPTLQLPARDVQFWEPNSMFSSWNKTKVERGIPSGYVIGRLKPGVTFQQAQAD